MNDNKIDFKTNVDILLLWIVNTEQTRMSSFRKPLGLLIDLSGTIHIEDQVIQGSIEAVNLLRRQKVPFLFVTNTTKVS